MAVNPYLQIYLVVFFMTFPEALKRARKRKGASQALSASAAHISNTQYQNYEYGKSEPTLSVLIALADFFDVSLDYLAGRSDDPTRH